MGKSGQPARGAAIFVAFLALASCVGAQAGPVSVSRASVALAARASQPARCPIGTSAGQPGNCLLDEGWSNDCPTSASCKDAGLGPNVHPLRPVASDLRIHVSTTMVKVGDVITVSASISAPRCTYALVNLQAHCWNNLQFGTRGQYLPTTNGGGLNPPLLRYDHACGDLPYYQPYKSTSCRGTIIWNYGPRKILPGHLWSSPWRTTSSARATASSWTSPRWRSDSGRSRNAGARAAPPARSRCSSALRRPSARVSGCMTSTRTPPRSTSSTSSPRNALLRSRKTPRRGPAVTPFSASRGARRCS